MIGLVELAPVAHLRMLQIGDHVLVPCSCGLPGCQRPARVLAFWETQVMVAILPFGTVHEVHPACDVIKVSP